MLEQQEKEIDGIEFRYQPMMLKPTRAMFDQLSQRFGPAIASAVEGLSAADIDMEMEVTAMLGSVTSSAGGLIRGVVAGLDPAYHAKLADTLAANTEYKNDAGAYVPLDSATREIMFGCRLLTETKLIGWCLSVQYADFLAPLRDLSVRAVMLRATASAFNSPKASTGSYTASPQATNTATA